MTTTVKPGQALTGAIDRHVIVDLSRNTDGIGLWFEAVLLPRLAPHTCVQFRHAPETPTTSAPDLTGALAGLVVICREMDSLGPMDHLSCSEAEALADVLRAYGEPELGQHLVDLHAEADEPGDLHFRGVEP